MYSAFQFSDVFSVSNLEDKAQLEEGVDMFVIAKRNASAPVVAAWAFSLVRSVTNYLYKDIQSLQLRMASYGQLEFW